MTPTYTLIMIRISLILFPFLLFAQEKITPKYIDSKIKEANACSLIGKHDLLMKKNEEILKNSRQIHYSKGITSSCLNLSSISFSEGNYKKSLEYLNQVRNEKYAQDNIDTQMKIRHLISYNYIAIGLVNDAISELKDVINLSDGIPTDSGRIYNKASILIDLGVLYRNKMQFDSATWFIKKGINTLPGRKSPKMQYMADLGYIALVEVKIDENKIDSADIYLKTVEARSGKLTVKSDARRYQLRGLIYERKKDYRSAITNYQKALELSKETKNIHNILDIYGSLSQAYLKINDKKAYREAHQKYTSIKDSLNRNSEHSTENIVKELITKKEEKLNSQNQFLMYVVIAVALLIIIISIFIFRRIRSEKKILQEKNKEAKLLTKKLNTDFEEVVRLGKNNDPEFLARFQEVYPEFFPNLLKIEPKLLMSELGFCALLFLNFSSKDIAQYTLVQPQSIQTRKNRLRKKLGIPSHTDIYLWMKDINSNREEVASPSRSAKYHYKKYNLVIKRLNMILKSKKNKSA
ncbi:tetratricopeptide repeat protein [Chryseobacterium kwangjuense]|nr:hypothetical protein [Chryseobacterium kwangjuense]